MTVDVQTSNLTFVDTNHPRYSPGKVRDAIVHIMAQSIASMSVGDITRRVEQIVGPTPSSSVRSYLRLNTPNLFIREDRGVYRLKQSVAAETQIEHPVEIPGKSFEFGKARLIHADCFEWIASQKLDSIHAVVTDPPCVLHEYTVEQQSKLRSGKGGVWRIPPSFDGQTRSPLPRFTTLTRGRPNRSRI